MGLINSTVDRLFSTEQKECKEMDERYLSMLSDFTALGYDAVDRNEALIALLDNKTARYALFEYILNSDECRQLLRKRESRNNSESMEEIVQQFERPTEEIDVTSRCVESFSYYVDSLLSGLSVGENEELRHLLRDSSRETIILISLSVLPRFLKSDNFKSWRKQEANRTIKIAESSGKQPTTLPDILPVEDTQNNAYTFVHAEADLPSQFCTNISEIKDINSAEEATDSLTAEAINDISKMENEEIEKAMGSIDCLEVQRVLKSGSWMFAFVAAVENLPVCITLCSARKERYGFPLIYVNKQFEMTSGYDRSVIIGANCRFLQRNAYGFMVTEKDSVNKLALALHKAQSIRVAITNYRRDGTPFKNLLSMKPVFDWNGEYQYVIGVQFDLSACKVGSRALEMADCMTKLLPSVIVS